MIIKKIIKKPKNSINLCSKIFTFKKFNVSVIYAIIGIIFLTSIAYSIPVIPGEEGFGMETPAGRGGTIYKITNLNPTGSGSLKECVDAIGPRTCIFEISGNIELTSHLKIINPYITIAGQSAPSPGITIAGAGIVIQTSDVLIQHIRIRVGDNLIGPAFDDRDSIKIESKYGNIRNVVIDHVSASWATDEIFSTWSYDGKVAEGITIINSIFSEALYNSKHPDGKHSMGMLIGKNTQKILISKNILAYNNYRNPLIRDDSTDVIFANNYIYNPGVGSKSKIYFGTTGINNLAMRASVVGNVFTENPAEYYDNMIYVESGSASNFGLYLNDNLGSLGTSDQWAYVMGRTDSSIRKTSPPVSVSGLSYLSSGEVKNYVFENAGARPFDRDSVDLRIISNMKAGKGAIIDSQNDVGGWPNLAVNKRTFPVPNNPNSDDDGDGYTNLEEVLHMYSKLVEFGDEVPQQPTTPPVVEPIVVVTDTTAPVITSSSPVKDLVLPSGTTSIGFSVVTDELAYCHYDDRANIDYLDQKYRFDNSNTKTHTTTLNGLVDGQSYTYYVRCKDMNTPNNYMSEDYIVTFSVSNFTPIVVEPTPTPIEEPTIDTTAPVITSSSPVKDLVLPSGTTSTLFSVVTDELAYCHYDDRANIDYLGQKYRFDNSITKTHTKTLSGLVDGQSYTYYVRCKDMNTPNNYMSGDYIVTFSVASSPVVIEEPVLVVEEPITVVKEVKGNSGGGSGGGGSKKTTPNNKVSLSGAMEFSTDTIESINKTLSGSTQIASDLNLKEKTKEVIANVNNNDNIKNDIKEKNIGINLEIFFKFLIENIIKDIFRFFSTIFIF